MTHPTAPPPAQRAGVLAAVLVLHILLLLLILAVGGARSDPAPVKPRTMSLISIAPDAARTPAPTPPPPPSLPSATARISRPLTDVVFAEEYEESAVAVPGGGCATLQLLTKALLADPAAVAAVVNAPPETRSIADAIVMWNAGWIEAAQSPEAPLSVVRIVTEQSLSGIEDGCLDEQIAGPRLIAIPAGDRTAFVVFGSGTWRWRELVSDENQLMAREPSAPLRSD